MNGKPSETTGSTAGNNRTSGGVASREMRLRWMDCGGIGLFTFIEISGIAMFVVIVFQLMRLLWR